MDDITRPSTRAPIGTSIRLLCKGCGHRGHGRLPIDHTPAFVCSQCGSVEFQIFTH